MHTPLGKGEELNFSSPEVREVIPTQWSQMMAYNAPKYKSIPTELGDSFPFSISLS